MVSNRASIFFVAGAAVLLCFFFLDIPLPGNDNTELMDMKAQRGTNATEAVLDLEPEDPPPPPLAKTVDLTPLYYSSNTLIRMSKQLRLVAGKLLIYDPKQDQFITFTVSPNSTTLYLDLCPRCPDELRVIIKALVKVRPQRFQPDQPPFQLFWTNRDFYFTSCDPTKDCFTHPSWVHLASYFKNRTLMPNVSIKPNYDYMRCIHELQLDPTFEEDELCSFWKAPFKNTTVTQDEFNKLSPKVVWRGHDRPFLPGIGAEHFVGNYSVPELPFKPRARAVELFRDQPTNDPSKAWLNIGYGSNTGKRRFNSMTNSQQAGFKYQIDLGGTSGTTWTGTLEKLAMPGLLFHHEGPSRDWYFDEMIAWKHYVPVRSDLADLREKYDWAEAHPEEAKRISDEATIFAKYMFSKKHAADELETYFGEASLGSLVDAYQPLSSNETYDSILADYKSNGIHLFRVSWCGWTQCNSIIKPRGFVYTYSLVNRSECSIIRCPF